MDMASVLSHTPPSTIIGSYEKAHTKRQRQRSNSISGRLRSASDLEERGLIDRYQKGVLKDLIISGDRRLQDALDKYESGDTAELEALMETGVLNRKSSLDFLEDLDMGVLNMGILGKSPKDPMLKNADQFEMDDIPTMTLRNSEQFPIDDLQFDTTFETEDDDTHESESDTDDFKSAGLKGGLRISSLALQGLTPSATECSIFGNAGSIGLNSLPQSPSTSVSPPSMGMGHTPDNPFNFPDFMATELKPHTEKATSNLTDKKRPATKVTVKSESSGASAVQEKPKGTAASAPIVIPGQPKSSSEETGSASKDTDSASKFIGAYSPESRRRRIERFIEKRKKRVWTKKVKYDVRKNFADSRLRVKGRFVKKEDEELLRELIGMT